MSTTGTEVVTLEQLKMLEQQLGGLVARSIKLRQVDGSGPKFNQAQVPEKLLLPQPVLS